VGEDPLAKYLEDPTSEEEYLKTARPGHWICINHYLIGLVRLSEGDREGARKHFKTAVDTRFYSHITYPYARAFLERLERDEKWPQWIEHKE
jgi:hypothetical protein